MYHIFYVYLIIDLLIFGALIYNEIIVLNFLGLEKNTKLAIDERSLKEQENEVNELKRKSHCSAIVKKIKDKVIHDICKDFPDEELLELAAKDGKEIFKNK